MDREHVRIIQRKLTEMGLYHDEIDGLRGKNTYDAVDAGIARLGQGTPNGFSGWPDKRRTVAFFQAYAQSMGIEVGDIDGLWGNATTSAAIMLSEKLTTGKVTNIRDAVPDQTRNPNGFPIETRAQTELRAFYGAPGTATKEPPLENVPLPWKMKIAWNRNQSRSSIRIHRLCAPSLKRVLDRIDAAYSAQQKSDLGIDIFSGDYNTRALTGASRPSLHSYGIAIDFDHQRNGLNMGWSNSRLARADAMPFWEAWCAEGWCSLGLARGFDFMHVQAAKRAY